MDAVEEIKQRLSIEDVVAEYVQLKRAGRNLKGLSPFTNEKSPSFMVSPEKQIWHDFSSGKGGDMFTFVQEVEGLDFKGALDLLARKAGVDLEQLRGRSGGNAKKKERLYDALEWATKFYQTQLKASRPALEYLLKQRAFSKDTVLQFRLGYSPNQDDSLVRFLARKKFTDDEIKGAGLSTKRYRGTGDMFRGRIMVPLADAQGRVIGFTARLLEDDPDAPKYINTPQTMLYDKGRHAYGLHLAKDAIRKQKYAVVVEGNLDVIASHQAGVKNVIASAGTALTEYHLKTIGRFASDIRFAFDSDRAGIAATERAIPIAQKTGVNMSIIDIPGGKDPDELVRKDPRLWQDVIDKHVYAVDWLIGRYAALLNLKTGQGKRQFTDIVLNVIRGLSDTVEQDHYIAELAAMIGVSPDAIRSKLQSGGSAARLKKVKAGDPPVDDKATLEHRRIEHHLLALALMQPKVRPHLQLLNEDMFSEEPARRLYGFIKQLGDKAPDAAALKDLQPIGDYVKITILQFEELYQSLEITELLYEASRLQARLVEDYVKTKKKELSGRMRTAEDADMRALQMDDKQLNELLKHVKDDSHGSTTERTETRQTR
jgi:DNA primase